MRYGLGVVLIVCALTLGACGVRGDLELPPKAVNADAAATGDAGEAERKPSRRFVLDPLL